jgi:hypothetical protein
MKRLLEVGIPEGIRFLDQFILQPSQPPHPLIHRGAPTLPEERQCLWGKREVVDQCPGSRLADQFLEALPHGCALVGEVGGDGEDEEESGG